MDIRDEGSDYGAMSKTPRKPAGPIRRQFRLLYVGQWIRALDRRPTDVARGSGVNEGYLSELINGRKANPGGHVLLAIAAELGIPMDYLYRPPPDQKLLEKLDEIEPEILAKLRAKGRKSE